jgi:hypothetical protein
MARNALCSGQTPTRHAPCGGDCSKTRRPPCASHENRRARGGREQRGQFTPYCCVVVTCTWCPPMRFRASCRAAAATGTRRAESSSPT